MAPFIAELAAGACLSAALLSSRLYAPSVITSQMRLQDGHMLESYIIAGAISTLLVSAANAAGRVPINVRTPKTIGALPFDANIIGGALQGIGMALSASCPATVFVQVGLGMASGVYSLLGCMLGGVCYVVVAPRLQRHMSRPGRGNLPQTLSGMLGVSQVVGALGFAALSVGVVLVFDAWTWKFGLGPAGLERWHEHHILAGAYVGLAQAATMLLVRRTVGVSTSFEDVGKALVASTGLRRTLKGMFTPSTKFACGVVIGTIVFAQLAGIKMARTAADSLHKPRLIAGGAAMVFGARLAGGCTSGHGISGIATLSLASFITVAAMYGGGIATAMLL